MFSFKNFTQSKAWIATTDKKGLLELITTSFVGVEPKSYFQKYFQASDVFERKLRVYYSDSKVIGYCLISFTRASGKVLLRASAAFYPEYRNRSNTFGYSFKQAIGYYFKHPLSKIYYADTMLSPAMYRATAKNTAIIWPSADCELPPKTLFEELNPDGVISEGNGVKCLLPVGRKTNYSEEEVHRFKVSDKKEIRHYCELNPEFDQGMALFVIVPISLKQILMTAWQKLFNR